MNIKDIVRDKTCYIISSELKNEILSYLNINKILIDIHFFTLKEIIDRVYFKYDYKTIYFTSREFHLSYNNAKIMIDNIKYLLYSTQIDDPKYNYLKKIKDYLDKEKLIVYDSNFLNYLKRYNILTDLSKNNEFLHKINELLEKKIEFLSPSEKKEAEVYEFINSENEIEFIANKISFLLQAGITPDHIHILNYSKDYKPFIDKIFTLYNIPFYISEDNYLYSCVYIKKLYNCVLNNEELSLKDDENHRSLNVKFMELLNSLSYINDTNEKNDFFLYLLKNTKIKNDNYINVIKFSSFYTYYLHDHYYFFIGLNNKVFPSYKKNEDYLDDNIKKSLGYLTSYESNKYLKEYCLDHLKYNGNYQLSYRKSDYFNAYRPSDLINEITKAIKQAKETNIYSRAYDKLKLAKNLDDYYKYDYKSEELINLLTKLNKEEYQSYDNSYTQVNNTYYLENIAKNKLSISYSSLQKFNECNYKYYLDSILKENEATFITYLGNLAHHILEKVYEQNFDFDKAKNSFSSEYILSNKESILLDNLLEYLKDKVLIIREQLDKTDFKNIKQEENISIKIKTNISVNINGYIDKIMLDNENHGIVVDYKTGSTVLTLDYLDYGLNCQLPFYFYLLNKSVNYANIFLVGCYLQIINFSIKSYDSNTKELLLEGLTYNDENVISKIDNSYNVESFIKGIKPNKKGLGTYAKLFDEETFNIIIEKMDRNIKNMIDSVNQASFDINPKIIKKNETTCRYCKYKDICFHTFKDYIDIREGVNDELDG